MLINKACIYVASFRLDQFSWEEERYEDIEFDKKKIYKLFKIIVEFSTLLSKLLVTKEILC